MHPEVVRLHHLPPLRNSMAINKQPAVHMLIFGSKEYTVCTPCNRKNTMNVGIIMAAAMKAFEDYSTFITKHTTGMNARISFDIRRVTCQRCLKRMGSRNNWIVTKKAVVNKKVEQSKLKKMAALVNKEPSLV